MMQIGFHASHEQFPPSEMLACVVAAEAAGFQCAMSSDHFKPWSRTQGHSGYSWSWMGAALARTRFPIGLISVAGYRYHPTIVAQAAATLGEMFGERFWFALGSGERLNEDITGMPWPTKPERNAKLTECAALIRRLLNGEKVTHRGTVTIVDAELYSRPAQPPRLFGAAVSTATARLVGQWADGLLTVANKPQDLRAVIDAFREGGGAGKPIHIQVATSWARSESEAQRIAHDQWKYLVGGDLSWELRSPEEFEQAARYVRPEDMHGTVRISADLNRHAAWLAEYAELGVETAYIHHVGLNQRAFIDAFGAIVLPQLR
jgi:coenzyme F420-dependent glucose-6-phosphate dehydrogenase